MPALAFVNLAGFHHESHALKGCNVRERIASNGNEISKFPGLDSTYAILPAHQFRGVDGDRAGME